MRRQFLEQFRRALTHRRQRELRRDAVLSGHSHALARWPSSKSDVKARRRAAASPGSTTSPVTPCWLTQGTPDRTFVLTTGVPHAIASTWTNPKASARVIDGRMDTSAAWYARAVLPVRLLRENAPDR